MTSLPIPFITAFLLLLLAASNHLQLKQTATGRIFEIVLYVNVVSLICIGFRWSHELKWLLPIAATLTIVSTALLYLAFRSLGRTGTVVSAARDWPHLIPVLLIVAATFIQPHWIDILLIAIKVFYAALFINMAWQAPSSLQLVRLNLFRNSQHALWAVAALLLLSAAIDAFIAIDFAIYDGSHSAQLVGATNMLTIIFLGWAAVMAGRGRGLDDGQAQASITQSENNLAAQTEPLDSSTDGTELLNKLNELLVDQGLYADSELNLQKLARKAGVPTRAVSRAINAHAGVNVSQWINSARIDAACDRLKNKDVSVTQVMMDAGFVTKSNFNREFKRLKGCSPSQWRNEN